jgi:hypothetical protein
MLIVFGAATAMLFPRECVAANAAPDPETVFRNPPQSTKTGVWWHWMGSNVSKEGIVKDLDWFKETGIGAATIFGMADVCSPWATKIKNSPNEGLIAFTPEWWALVRFACEEAEKRGIEIGIRRDRQRIIERVFSANLVADDQTACVYGVFRRKHIVPHQLDSEGVVAELVVTQVVILREKRCVTFRDG